MDLKTNEKLTRKWIIGMMALASIVIIIGMMIKYGNVIIHKVDHTVIQLIQYHISEPLTNITLAITFFGSAKGIMLLTSLFTGLLFLFRKFYFGLYLGISVSLGAGGLNKILKVLFSRERPTILRVVEETGYSYPSGHAMGTTILFGGLVFIIFKMKRHAFVKLTVVMITGVIIFIMGLTRIYLGVHYPSDIIGGYIAGIAWLIFSVTTFHYLELRWKRRKPTQLFSKEY